MRIVAVVTSPVMFRKWAARQANLLSLSDVTALGGTDHFDAWTAHRLDSLDVPWQGGVNEVVLLPASGEAVATPRDLLPPPPPPPPPVIRAAPVPPAPPVQPPVAPPALSVPAGAA